MIHRLSHSSLPNTCTRSGLKLLGDYWTLAIIGALSSEEKRFCQLQRDLNNVNPVTLSNRLKKLELAELIFREEETLDKLSVTYQLTQKGKDILPLIREIEKFSQKYL